MRGGRARRRRRTPNPATRSAASTSPTSSALRARRRATPRRTPTRACDDGRARARARPARRRRARASAPRPSSTRATAACTPTCRTTSRASSPSPRLVGQLLAGEGVDAGRRASPCFDARRAAAPASARCGCSGDAQTPLAERPIKVADRLAAFLLGAAHGRARRSRRGCACVALPAHDPGPRRGGRARSRALLARPSHAADRARRAGRRRAARARRSGARCVAVHVRDLEQRDVMADAALVVARSRAGRSCFDGPRGPRARPSARALLRAIDERARARSCSPRRTRARGARARRPHRAAGRGAAADASPSASQAWADLTGAADDRRRRREVPALDRRRSSRPPRSRRLAARRARRRDARAAPTSTSARARPRRRGSASSPRGSTPGYRWDDLVLPDRQRELLQLDLAPTCATATACCPSGATSARSPAPRA